MPVPKNLDSQFNGSEYKGQHIGVLLALLLLFYWFFLRGDSASTITGPAQEQLDYTHNNYGPVWGDQPFHSATW